MAIFTGSAVAIVTPFNVSWSLYQLILELEKEAETMKQYRKTK